MKQTQRRAEPGAALTSRMVRDDPDEVAMPRMTIPGDAGTLAEEEAAEGVEGRPADPKASPWGLRAQILLGLGVLVVFSAVVSVWLGWGAGLAALGIGLLGMVFNPLTMATILRARDREPVLEHHVRIEQGRDRPEPSERAGRSDGAGPPD